MSFKQKVLETAFRMRLRKEFKNVSPIEIQIAIEELTNLLKGKKKK